ncbi:hypothetical protein I2F27_09970 [Acinetobacter sp. B5B]|uniref:hypothetical protein n=1 Tax=Acinetobacter baretiae TaxID=2605383 RepID=UPI0018C202D4|nr:hypothetical protein [Acinetobacter baretiae]MBF7683645.1 hypothetical protein [Acinetobacter baretiae]
MSSAVWFSPIYSMKAQSTRRAFGTSFDGVVDYLEYFTIRKAYLESNQIPEPPRLGEIRNQIIPFKNKRLDFYPIPLENAPTALYGYKLSHKIHPTFPGFFKTDDSLVVTDICKILLEQFNLGEKIQFFPVPLYDAATNQPVNNEIYYVMNIADWRSFLVPEFCEGELWKARRLKPDTPRHALTEGKEFDNAIALSAEASNCDLDLWHDPSLFCSLFMSDRLKQALEQAGFLANFHICATKLIHKS